MDGNLVHAEADNAGTEWSTPVGSDSMQNGAAVPMIVKVDHVRCRVNEWTVSGFTLETPMRGLRLGDVRSVRIELQMSDVDIGFDMPCQVTGETEGGAAEFEFLGAFTEQSALLYRIAEDRVAGYATQFNTLLCSQPRRQPARARRTLFLGVLVSLLVVSIAILIAVVLTSLLTVRSSVGAVTVEGVVLRAPATGVLTGEFPPPGSRVYEGQPLFQILTADMTTKLAELSGELHRLEAAYDYTRARRREIKEVTNNLRSLTEQKLDAIKAKITALDKQISIYAKLVDNKQYLADHGFHPQSGVDTQRVELETRREARDDAQSDLQIADTQGELLKSGILTLDWQDNMETKATMRLLVAEAESAITKAQAMLIAIGEANRVTSPCNCLVYATDAKSGEVAEAGTLIYMLRPDRAVPVVMALIPADQTVGLTIGNTASVSLVTGLVAGRLERLSYDDQQTSRVGLFPLVRSTTASTADQQLAQATISVRDRMDASLIGTPAQVAIRSNPLPRAVAGFYALLASL